MHSDGFHIFSYSLAINVCVSVTQYKQFLIIFAAPSYQSRNISCNGGCVSIELYNSDKDVRFDEVEGSSFHPIDLTLVFHVLSKFNRLLYTVNPQQMW